MTVTKYSPVTGGVIRRGPAFANANGGTAAISRRPPPPSGIIVGVGLGVLDKDTINKLAVAETDNEQNYKYHVVEKGSVNDPRMGTSDEFMNCQTCADNMGNCPGHMGKITFCMPLFMPEMLAQHLFKVLRVTCWNCCRCLVRPDNSSFHKVSNMVDCKKKMTKLMQLSDNIRVCGQYSRRIDTSAAATAAKKKAAAAKQRRKRAASKNNTAAADAQEEEQQKQKQKQKQNIDGDDHDEEEEEEETANAVDDALQNGCGAMQPLYEQDGVLIRAIYTLSAKHGSDPSLPIPQFDLNSIYEMLSYIPDSDARLMEIGGRPEDMLFSVMAVIPPIDRPTISRTVGSHVRGQADLSKTLKNIVKLNKAVRKKIEACPNDTASLAVYEYAGFKHTDPNIVIEYAKQWDACGGQVSRLVDFTANSGGTKKNRKRKRPTRKVAAQLAATAAASNAAAAAADQEDDDDDGEEDGAAESLPLPPPHSSSSSNSNSKNTPTATTSGGGAASSKSLLDLFIELQVAVAQFSNSELGAQYMKARTHGTKAKGMRQYYMGKHGRIRGDATGSRGGLCGRSVITPDPNVGIDEIGVPEEFCRIMIRQERVSPFNVRRFTNMVRRGEIQHVTNQFGELLDLNFINRQNVQLQYGDIIERPLQNGDRLPFNRQPSLHKYSIMSHRVKVLPGGTYRMPPGATTPYNADCDGDEMAGWAVNNQPSRAEARYLTAAKEHIVAAAASKPIMSTVQDGLSGLFVVTGQDMFLTRAQMMQLVVESGLTDTWDLPQPALQVRDPRTRKWVPKWTGKQLFSLLLPADYLLDASSDSVADNLRATSRSSNNQQLPPKHDGDLGLIIRCGQLLHGQLRKQWVGNTASGIVHTLFNDYGPTFASDFLSRAQLMATNSMMVKSISVGPTDCQHPNAALTKPIVERALAFVNQFDKHQPEDGNEHTENIIGRVLSGARDHIGDILLEQLDQQSNRNGFYEIVKSGSKGSVIDEVQVHALLGQQNQKSKRIGNKLPQFPGLTHAKRHGFVERNFFEGLDDIEFFFHAMGGREGLSDTACKTAETGYTQKRLCNGMKNHVVRNDGTVRNTSGLIISYRYGDDGFDASRLVESPLNSLKLSNLQLRQRFSAAPVDWDLSSSSLQQQQQQQQQQQWDQWLPLLTPEAGRRFMQQVHGGGGCESVAGRALAREWRTLQELRNQLRTTLLRNHTRLVDRVMMPVNFERLMSKLDQRRRRRLKCGGANNKHKRRRRRNNDENDRSDMTPWEVHLAVRAFYDELVNNNVVPNHRWEDDENENSSSSNNDPLSEDESPLYNVMISIAEWLSTYRLVHVHRVCRDDLQWLFRHIGCKLLLAQVAPGEAVGILGGTSIGERSTQMTLNSVDYHTDLVIRWHSFVGATRYGCIGQLIDELMQEFPDRIVKYANNTLYLPLDAGMAEALTVDEDGSVSWKALEAVTKHPPNNADGSNTLVKITTEAGRTVIGTRAKSFLVFDEATRKIIDVNGDTLKVGDLVPITLLPSTAENAISTVDLGTIFRPTEFIFTNNVIAAKHLMETRTERNNWWHHVKDTIPHSRGDIFRDAIYTKKCRQQILEPNQVYTKTTYSPTTSPPLPQRLELTRAFGFFVGAYLAEGCLTDHQVHISNNDDGYRAKSAEWPTLMGIGNHETPAERRQAIDGRGIMFHSTITTHLLRNTCGSGSGEKRVPTFAYSASQEFVLGLLDAYISGDGSVAKNGAITSSSRSRALTEGICLLFSTLNIRPTISTTIKKFDRDENDLMHSIYIGIPEVVRLRETLTLTIGYKQQRMVDAESKSKYAARAKSKSKARYEDRNFENVWLDPIVSIEPVESSHPHVYDLTVAETRNMVTASGLAVRDSFHKAGDANALVGGVPRFNEIINKSPNQKTPSMKLVVRPESIEAAIRVPIGGGSPAFPSAAAYVRNLASGLVRVNLQGFLCEDIVDSVIDQPWRSSSSSSSSNRRTTNDGDDDDLAWLWRRFEWAIPPEEQRADFTSAVMRLHLNREKCLVHRVSILDIVEAIQHQIGRDHIFVHSLPADEEWWVCVRVRKSSGTWSSLRSSLSPASHPTVQSSTAQEADMWRRQKKQQQAPCGGTDSVADAIDRIAAEEVVVEEGDGGSSSSMWLGAGEPHEQFVCRTLVDCLVNETRICGLASILSANASVERYTAIVPDSNTGGGGDSNMDAGATVMLSRWVVNTAGTNLMGAAHIEDFDFGESFSNSIHDTEPNLGIEASQLWIELEVNTVLDATGGNVNGRHNKQLDEGMTARGYVTPMTRNGISKQDVSVLECMSFEKPLEYLANACVRREMDPVSGAQECVFVNNLAPLGTGTVDLRNMPTKLLQRRQQQQKKKKKNDEATAILTLAPPIPTPPHQQQNRKTTIGAHLVPSREVALANDRRVRGERSFIPELSADVMSEYFSRDPLDMVVERACLWPRPRRPSTRRAIVRQLLPPTTHAATTPSRVAAGGSKRRAPTTPLAAAALSAQQQDCSPFKRPRLDGNYNEVGRRRRLLFMNLPGHTFVPASERPLFPAPPTAAAATEGKKKIENEKKGKEEEKQQHQVNVPPELLIVPGGVVASLRMHTSSVFVAAVPSTRNVDLLDILPPPCL